MSLSFSWSEKKRFQLFTVEYDTDCGPIIYGLYYVEVHSLYSDLVDNFYHKWMLNFDTPFLYLSTRSYNPVWSWCIIYVEFGLLVFGAKDFCTRVHQRHWSVIFFSCGVLIWFWYLGNAGLIKWVWKSSLLFYFWEEVERTGTWMFSRITSEAIWSWTFVGGFLISDSTSLLVISPFRFSISSWFSLGRLYDPTDVGNLISGSSAFSKSSLNMWKFLVHVLSKPGLENFDHYFASVWDECNSAVLWIFFGTVCLWNWKENWPFPVL